MKKYVKFIIPVVLLLVNNCSNKINHLLLNSDNNNRIIKNKYFCNNRSNHVHNNLSKDSKKLINDQMNNDKSVGSVNSKFTNFVTKKVNFPEPKLKQSFTSENNIEINKTYKTTALNKNILKNKIKKIVYKSKEAGLFGIGTGLALVSIAIVVSVITTKGYTLLLTGAGLTLILVLSIFLGFALSILW